MRLLQLSLPLLLSVVSANMTLANNGVVTSEQTDPATRGKAIALYGRMPLAFEVNQGQTDPRVNALARGSGYGLFLTADESVLVLAKSAGHTAVVRTKLLGANSSVRVQPADRLPGTINSFIGNNPSKWRTDVPTYSRMEYQDIYPGIDLVYYGNQQQLEYDFIVAPGADPQAIRFAVTGAKISIDPHGDLVLRTKLGEVRHHRPVIYQEIDGIRHEVSGRFVKYRGNQVAFAVAPYDRRHKLVIDPTLAWSTYLGGSGVDKPACVAVDKLGDTLFAGVTSSQDFPTNGLNAGPFPTYLGGSTDAFFSVIFFSGSGSSLYISSYYGGSGNDSATGMTILNTSLVPIVYGVGTTTSTDLPTVAPLQPNLAGGSDAFVVELKFPNVIAYSSYLGGSGNETSSGIMLDSLGNTTVTGYTDSTDFPTVSPIQAANAGGTDCFVTKLNSTFTGYVYSTYLGGPGNEKVAAIADAPNDRAYIVGSTTSSAFSPAGRLLTYSKAFLASLDPTGQTAPIATQIFGGQSISAATGVVVDQASSRVWMTGYTASPNFYTVNPIQAAKAGQYDAFLVAEAPGGKWIFSTYWGGSGTDMALAIALDASGNPFIAGTTNSTNFPTTSPLQATNAGGYDGFVTRFQLHPGGAPPTAVYSTYLGGSGSDSITAISVDSKDIATVVGSTTSTNFPVTTGVIQPVNNGQTDTFVTRINP